MAFKLQDCELFDLSEIFLSALLLVLYDLSC